MTRVNQISETVYEFLDWRGEVYEALRGNREYTAEAKDAQRVLDGYHIGGIQKMPEYGYRWHVYNQNREDLGSYLSPIKAAEVFQKKRVELSGFFS